MSSSAGVLDFFVIEANEYIERLDALIASGGATGPESAAFARNARMLRGSATMSRREGIAAVAGALERVARALGEQRLTWEAALAAVVTGSVDDLRILLRNARSWSAPDDQRSSARAAELARYAPDSAAPAAPPPSQSNVFLAGETSELATVLDRFVAAPTSDTLSRALQRLRALRGVADVRDMAPVAEVMETVEGALRASESRADAGAGAGAGIIATDAQRSLARAAAAFLRRASREIGLRGHPDSSSAELADFHAAASTIPQHSGKGDRIVPISQLFHDDVGPHIVSANVHPPTTAAERFRLEVVSMAEHLRAVVAEARIAGPGAQRDKAGREMRNALRALGSTAHSFGERAVARFAAEWSTRASNLDERGLDELDEVARLLANPASRPADVSRELERLVTQGEGVPGATTRAWTTRAATAQGGTAQSGTAQGGTAQGATPRGAPTRVPSRTPLRTPTGRDLQELLEDGIASFLELDVTPLSAPAVLDDERIVPIEGLLYSGRAALERAVALRAELLDHEGAPPREAVDELFDLIELALAE